MTAIKQRRATNYEAGILNIGEKKRHQKMKVKIIITAILCITLMELMAMWQGINGNILRIVIAAVAGLAGLATKRPKILGDG